MVKIRSVDWSCRSECAKVKRNARNASAIGIRTIAMGKSRLAGVPVMEEDNEFAAVQMQEDGDILATG